MQDSVHATSKGTHVESTDLGYRAATVAILATVPVSSTAHATVGPCKHGQEGRKAGLVVPVRCNSRTESSQGTMSSGTVELGPMVDSCHVRQDSRAEPLRAR